MYWETVLVVGNDELRSFVCIVAVLSPFFSPATEESEELLHLTMYTIASEHIPPGTPCFFDVEQSSNFN